MKSLYYLATVICEQFVTLSFASSGFVFRIVESRLGPEMKEKVTNVSLTQNGDSALFDIPTADKDQVYRSEGSKDSNGMLLISFITDIKN